MQNDKIFIKVLNKFNESGLLEDLILIGGWCLFVYREYFNNSILIPLKRTTDLDLLIPNPPKLKHTADIASLLNELDFRLDYNLMNNFYKFVHPDLEVEFLMNQKGQGNVDFYEVKALSVKAVQLRYLGLLENNSIKVKYHDLFLNIPEPAAFTLHKFIISDRRKNKIKAEKDLETAKEMSDFLLTVDEQKKKMINIFNSLPAGWKKSITGVVKLEHKELFELLKS